MPGLQTVYQLQNADLERAETARKLREAEKGLGETDELRGARATMEGEEAGLSHLRTRVRDLELELKSLTAKIVATEQRLYGGDVRNPKELESLQTDIQYLRSHREELEDRILTDLTEIDDAQKRLKQAQARWEAIQATWQAQQARLQKVVGDLREHLGRLEEEVARLRAALPAALLADYDEACRKQGGRGIAAIRGGLCEGCRVAVPTGIVQQVRRGDETRRCTSCGRILCVVE